MIVRTLTENLARSLSIATRFTGGKVQLPVLSNVLLKTNSNKLMISATNLETSISINIGAKVEQDGEITVPGKIISDIVNNLPSGPLEINVEQEKLVISNASFKSVVLGTNASDYPSIPQTKTNEGVQLKTSLLSNMLSKTLFAVSVDETRPVLTGLLFIMKDSEITFVATDGFRLSSKKNNVKNLHLSEEQRIILPRNTMSELLRTSTASDVVEFSFVKEDNQAIFSFSETVLTSRVIQGDFPDFERIIPKNPVINLEVDREDLLRSVKLASVFARDSANVVKMKINKDKMEVFAESAKSGNQKIELDIKSDYSGNMTIAYNYRFLEDFLNCCESQIVKIELTDPNVPAIFKDFDDKDFFHIIMPIKLSE